MCTSTVGQVDVTDHFFSWVASGVLEMPLSTYFQFPLCATAFVQANTAGA